jgi:hypothetical protein
LIPFSFFEIDFRDSFEWKFNSSRVRPKISYISIQTLTRDLTNLLDSLEVDTNFSMGLSYIDSYNVWKKDKKEITPLCVNDAIIINKESDSILITQFIMKSLNDKGLFITNWLFKDYSLNTLDPRILVVTIPIIVKI